MMGHSLSACAQMAVATGGPRRKERVDYVAARMAECQKAHSLLVAGFHCHTTKGSGGDKIPLVPFYVVNLQRYSVHFPYQE